MVDFLTSILLVSHSNNHRYQFIFTATCANMNIYFINLLFYLYQFILLNFNWKYNICIGNIKIRILIFKYYSNIEFKEIDLLMQLN